MDKKQARLRRARRTRGKIQRLRMPRLSVHRTPRHIYAQIIAAEEGKVLASCSTLEKSVKEQVSNTGNKEAAEVVGKLIAEKAKEAGVTRVAFDRSGFKYHGRVKALAEAARQSGLEF